MRQFPSLSIVVALWLAGLCAAAQFAKVGLVLPELGRVYPDAGVSLGFIVSSVSIIGILFGLIAGIVVGHLGARTLLLGALSLGAVVSLAQAMLPPLPVLLASRVLEGVSHLAVVVAAPTLIATISTDRLRPAAMTLWGTFFGVSFALTAWLGLPLVEFGGPGALFLAHGVCTAAAAILLAIVLPRVPRSACEVSWLSPRLLLRSHISAWTSPFIAAPAAGWLFYTITFVALMAVLPGLMPPGDRVFVATAMPLASIATSMTIGVALLRRIDAVRVIMTGFFLAAMIAVILPFMPGEPLPCIALFAALGLVQGASFASVPQLNSNASDQALANGALAQAGNLGNACGTPLLLAVLATSGLVTMVALVILCYIAAIATHVWLAGQRRAETLSSC